MRATSSAPRSAAPQIVGVIADVRDHDLHGDVAPRIYMPYLQRMLYDPGSLRLELRTSGDPAGVTESVRRDVAAVDPNLPISSIAPLASSMRESLRQERLVATLASVFGMLALLLATIGLYGVMAYGVMAYGVMAYGVMAYGVMAYAVARRTGEIGLRVALGASAGDVVGLVVLDALRVVAIGLAVGAPLAIAAGQLLRSQLHGVTTFDPRSLGAALAVLVVTASAAALLPARRASRVTPLVALTHE